MEMNDMTDAIIIILLIFIMINTYFTPSTTSRVEELLKEICGKLYDNKQELKRLQKINELQNKIISNQEEIIKILKDKLE